MKKGTFIIIIIIIICLIGGGIYLYINKNTEINNTEEIIDTNGFSPFGRNTISTSTEKQENTISTTTEEEKTISKIPKLRKLSATPVAGMTSEENAIRFIDRGAGHIFEASNLNKSIEKISNTTLPKIYESYWNKDMDIVILRYLKENTDIVTTFYAEIRKTASTTSLKTPYEIKGKYLSSNIDQIAVSPKGNKIFTWNIENDNGIGYISSFDEKSKTKIIETPMNQVNIDWPEDSTVTITTRGSISASGYAYSIDTKTGNTKKLIGGMRGLSIKMSSDAKKVLYSVGGSNIYTNIINIKDGEVSELMFNTLADKCVWSSLRKNELYCAVPVEIPDGLYPDDWYNGKTLFIDQIWHLDTITGEVHLIANLLSLSNELIDVMQLKLNENDNYLYFMNKRDLSLWSLDLNQ